MDAETENNDIFSKLVEYYDSQAAIAVKFNLGPMAITQWKRRGIPMKYCPLIEMDTKGRFKCHQLRPDLFPAPSDEVAA